MQKHMLLADWQHVSASKIMLPQGQSNRSWMLWCVLSLFQEQLAQLKGSQERRLSCRAPVQPTAEATYVYFKAPLMPPLGPRSPHCREVRFESLLLQDCFHRAEDNSIIT